MFNSYRIFGELEIFSVGDVNRLFFIFFLKGFKLIIMNICYGVEIGFFFLGYIVFFGFCFLGLEIW